MARAKKICSKPGCPAITAASLCTTHAREADKARGTSTARGYGTSHINARKAMARQVATGNVRCARCNEFIKPGADWHLDHDDNDRTKYIGASCAHCNLSAAGKKSHQYD
jgi:hypothetical protein